MMQGLGLKDLVGRMLSLVYLAGYFVMINIIDGEVEALEILVTTVVIPTTITTTAAAAATSIKVLIVNYISLILFNSI